MCMTLSLVTGSLHLMKCGGSRQTVDGEIRITPNLVTGLLHLIKCDSSHKKVKRYPMSAQFFKKKEKKRRKISFGGKLNNTY